VQRLIRLLKIPTEISNVGIIEALYQCISEEELPKIKVVGYASLNLKFFSVDIPFEKTKDVGEEIRKRIREESIIEEAIGLRSGKTYTFVIEVVDGEGRYEGTFTTESYW